MKDPGEHGAGTGSEQERFSPVEDELARQTAQLGIYFVSRMRNQERWQLTIYGPPGLSESFDTLVSKNGAFESGAQPDGDWGYYFHFLSPDHEQWNWIMDRRVVDQLASHGDALRTPRQVDHTGIFPDRESADRFTEAVASMGFEIRSLEQQPDAPEVVVQFRRGDPVTLGHINAVASDLRQIAQQHSGDYDGWGCQVVSTEAR